MADAAGGAVGPRKMFDTAAFEAKKAQTEPVGVTFHTEEEAKLIAEHFNTLKTTAEVGRVSLFSQGWYLCYIRIVTTKGTSEKLTGSISIGTAALKTLEPIYKILDDGDEFAVMMDVAAGVDKVATEKYIYRQGNAGTASYQASGTVYINSLNYNW